ncbi:kynurenine 3-monooxygenase, mitochondrial precursor [Coemansia guatemalensis]|uniref:Kynurenine 3-monooxygenase n=1 Tax=Coemansia guatemalensis TaxID=2761395 RepID=A0A9W8HRM1_9FUNG|nr:kynurenine 3-monooxygenase, mitochondrial precursor [Coemansia guatemalensis]
MSERHVVIIGGGLVGSLTACYLAKRGWTVDLYEKRQDTRLQQHDGLGDNRSINLAISERGLAALRRLDPVLEARVKALAIPMHGRMIHALDGHQSSQPYDIFGKHINSVSRSALITLLLDEADSYPGVNLHFGHEFITANFDTGQVVLQEADSGGHNNSCERGRVVVDADLIVGADGAFSRVRQRMMSKVMINYSQTYIEHGYCELSMGPRNGDFAISPDHLHIWPRGSFMLIALPNLDRSFTCTLFMPWQQFDRIKSDADIVNFFRENFPDALHLMGEKSLCAEFAANPKCSLMYVKCLPHTYKNRVVILGDAAHAMVPFYGQGMNCGFEDIEVLDRIMVDTLQHANASSKRTADLSNRLLRRALDKYSAIRSVDTSAIVDLALENYIEMRAKVVDFKYLMRRFLEGLLYRMFPQRIVPLYSMVSFTSIPYADVVTRWNRQSMYLYRSIKVLAFTAAFGVGLLSARLLGLRLPSPSEIARIVTRKD